MNFQKFYKKGFGIFCLIFSSFSTLVIAQGEKPELNVGDLNREMPVAAGNNLYCAGYIQTSPVNTENKIVGAQNEQDQFIYSQGNYVYLSMGANRGAKVGDIYSVIRPRGQFKSEFSRKGKLGIYIEEVGAVEIVKVKNEVSVARIKTSCASFILGDLIQPTPVRTSPMYEQRPVLDVFAEPTGKTSGRIVMARDGVEMPGREQIVYIDLGAEDNVRVGDYFTIYRPLGKGNLLIWDHKEEAPSKDHGYQSEKYKGGPFSNQTARNKGNTAEGKPVSTKEAKEDRPKDLRKVVGELVILNVKEKTATAVIVRTAQEIHTGDMVELQ